MTYMARTKRKFRYEGDPREVKIEMSREDAYALAEHYPELKDFLEASEDSDADVIPQGGDDAD